MSKYRILYGINYGCYEFIDNEEISSFESLNTAVLAFKNLANNPGTIDFSPYDKEIESWDLQPEDYQYGEFYGGQIKLCDDDDHVLLHAGLDRDLKSKETWCSDIEYGEDITDTEKLVIESLSKNR